MGERFADFAPRKQPLTPGSVVPSPLGEGRYQLRSRCESKCRNSRVRQAVPLHPSWVLIGIRNRSQKETRGRLSSLTPARHLSTPHARSALLHKADSARQPVLPYNNVRREHFTAR